MKPSTFSRPFQVGRFTVSLSASALLGLLIAPQMLMAQGYKHVAVEPEQVQHQRLAEPQTTGVASHATMIPVRAGDTASGAVTHTLVVDNPEASPLAFLGPNTDDWQLQIIDPDGKTVLDERQDSELGVDSVRVGSESFSGKRWQLDEKKAGHWRVTLRPKALAHRETASQSSRQNNREVIGYLMAKGDPNYKLYSYRDTQMTLRGAEVNLVAYLVEAGPVRGARAALHRAEPLPASIRSARVTLTAPDNSELQLTLNDNGVDGDAVAGDGRFSVRLPTDQLGTYTQSLQVDGIRPDGLAFSRTANDLYPVVEQSYGFDRRSASLVIDSDTQARILLPVTQLGATEDVFAAAEVWGVDRRGRPALATWAGGIAQLEKARDGAQFTLHLDSRWLTRKGLQAPYELRNLRLQHRDNHVPLARENAKPLLGNHLQLQRLNAERSASITVNGELVNASMRAKQVGSYQPRSLAIAPSAAGGVLMLVHGYCSSSAWDTGHFSNAVEFKDYKANRSHDDFAKRIRDFGASYPSFGVVAHSQGGAAALHLYARYYSGLDNASGGRLIQSVGTPYQGTALAGNLAALGKIFGAGCGKNTDLTYSGAANWLATIPSWARAEVDYYTTSFKDRWWAYDYCHLATDLLLDDPEDGTTEKWSGQLSGAVNKGHKTGWCHTSGMRDPAQTRDTSRNSSMSSRAAR